MIPANVIQCAAGHQAIWYRPVWRATPEGPCRDPCPLCVAADQLEQCAAEIESLNRELSRVNAEQESKDHE